VGSLFFYSPIAHEIRGKGFALVKKPPELRLMKDKIKDLKKIRLFLPNRSDIHPWFL
jgi:hypothetical protein